MKTHLPHRSYCCEKRKASQQANLSKKHKLFVSCVTNLDDFVSCFTEFALTIHWQVVDHVAMVFFNSPIWSILCTIVPETLIFVTVFKQMAFHDYWTDLDDFLCFGKFMVHIFPKSYFRETTPDDLRQPSVESYQIMVSPLYSNGRFCIRPKSQRGKPRPAKRKAKGKRKRKPKSEPVSPDRNQMLIRMTECPIVV